MQYSKYKFKFYLNANHSIYIDGVLGEKHPHTWEIVLNTVKGMDVFIQFHHVEKEIENFLGVYQGTYINQKEPFTTINPTLENLCEYFNSSLKELLYKMGWVLTSIEISETPARSYIIDSLDEADNYINELEKKELDSEIDLLAEETAKQILASKEEDTLPVILHKSNSVTRSAVSAAMKHKSKPHQKSRYANHLSAVIKAPVKKLQKNPQRKKQLFVLGIGSAGILLFSQIVLRKK